MGAPSRFLDRIADSELESLRNLAAALFRLEKSQGPGDIDRVVAALNDWLREPGLEELRRSFAAWVMKVLLPARVPGVVIPQVEDLQEVRSMLAESVMDWTRQWKQEGLEEGRKEGLQEGLKEGRKEGLDQSLEKARAVLLRQLERRFGALDGEVRHRVDVIGSIEEISELTFRAGAASSLNELGLS